MKRTTKAILIFLAVTLVMCIAGMILGLSAIANKLGGL